MRFNLPYGLRDISIEIDDIHKPYHLEAKKEKSVKDPRSILIDRLRNPIGKNPLREIAISAKKVGIVVNDITRPTPTAFLLPPILNEIRVIDQKDITVFIATGSHRECTDNELSQILGNEIFNSYKIIQNNAFNTDLFTYLGKSKFENEIHINSELVGCDLVISVGFIEPHFFAGFSGGLKNILPGMSSIQSIMANHGLHMIDNEKTTWGITDGNPIWEEINSIKHLIPNTFLVNITLNDNKEVSNIFCGDVDEAYRQGCEYVKGTSMIEIPHLFDIFITTNSGYPLDINLYQTVKGMSAAAEAIKPGGAIVIFSECSDGIPDHGCYGKLLRESVSVDNLIDRLKERNQPIPDQWQAQIQAKVLKKADVFIFSDYLTDQQVNDSLLQKFTNFNEILDLLLYSRNYCLNNPQICVSPRGPMLVPFLNS